MAQSIDILIDHLEKEKDRLFRIAWRMCGNPDEAEDVVQDTALKAFKNWDKFRGDAKISTWLYRIASNTCFSKKRSDRFSVTEPAILDAVLEQNQTSLASMNDWSPDPLSQTLNNELREVIDNATANLPELYRIVFLMRDIEGMSGEETANALNISSSNVKVRLHRARMFLRDQLDSYIRTNT